MKWCNKCLIPDSRPGVTLNDGICMACSTHASRPQVDWGKRKQEFEELVKDAKSRNKGYDCMIPVSGGKDSTWQVVRCLEYGLKPLAFTQKVPLRTKLGQQNLDNLVSLGVDHIEYQVSPKVEAKFVKEAFMKMGSVGLPMHMAMYRMSLNMAAKFNIPYVIWGENSAVEYGSSDEEISGYKMDSHWLKKYGVSHGTGPEDWVSENLTEAEMFPYYGPSDSELDSQGIQAVFLGYYFEWDTYNSYKVARANGFQKRDEPRIGYYDFADLDDKNISVHHFLKWYKFGFTRAFDNLSIEIRNGRQTRESAVKLARKVGSDVPVEDIKSFCEFIDITEKEFYVKCEEMRNLDIWYKDNGTWKIKDFLTEDWDWE